MTDTPAGTLQAVLRSDPARPLITYYDDATGERTELSATSVANWVAKTANLLTDEAGVEPGQPVAVLLPAHWQTAVVLLALWSVGAEPVIEPDGAAAVIVDEPRLVQVVQRGGQEVIGLSLAPMNGVLRAAPPGVIDYAAEVLSAGDAYSAADPSGQTEVMAAQAWLDEVGLTGADRLLVSDPAGVPDALDWLLTPLVARASVVLCRNTDPDRLAKRAADERVTATLGATVEGVRRLD
jgi:uncharacterized protein (TIGR03089 family)